MACTPVERSDELRDARLKCLKDYNSLYTRVLNGEFANATSITITATEKTTVTVTAAAVTKTAEAKPAVTNVNHYSFSLVPEGLIPQGVTMDAFLVSG